MKFKQLQLPFIFAVLLCASFTALAQEKKTVWHVDFVKPKAGHYDDYLKFNQANWRPARALAQQMGFIMSYKVLLLPLNPNNQWDVMLMTEFADEQQYAAVEANFKVVFEKLRGNQSPTLINGLGARQLADIVKSEKLIEPKPEK